MPNYLIVRGLPALVIVATELISGVSGSWRTEVFTWRQGAPSCPGSALPLTYRCGSFAPSTRLTPDLVIVVVMCTMAPPNMADQGIENTPVEAVGQRLSGSRTDATTPKLHPSMSTPEPIDHGESVSHPIRPAMSGKCSTKLQQCERRSEHNRADHRWVCPMDWSDPERMVCVYISAGSTTPFGPCADWPTAIPR